MKRLPSIMGFVFVVSLTLLIKTLLAETYPIQPIQLVTTGAPGDARIFYLKERHIFRSIWVLLYLLSICYLI
jgi:hypothetical protein